MNELRNKDFLKEAIAKEISEVNSATDEPDFNNSPNEERNSNDMVLTYESYKAMEEEINIFLDKRLSPLVREIRRRPAPFVHDEGVENSRKKPARMINFNGDLTFREEECVICGVSKPNVLFCNCGHIVLCEECNDKSNLKNCPLCNKPSETKRKLVPEKPRECFRWDRCHFLINLMRLLLAIFLAFYSLMEVWRRVN